MWKFINWLFWGDQMKHHQCCDSGDIILGCGTHEIKIDTDESPCHISLRLTNHDGCVPVCHGEVNKVEFRTTCDGFLILADIRTNTCSIKWSCGDCCDFDTCE